MAAAHYSRSHHPVLHHVWIASHTPTNSIIIVLIIPLADNGSWSTASSSVLTLLPGSEVTSLEDWAHIYVIRPVLNVLSVEHCQDIGDLIIRDCYSQTYWMSCFSDQSIILVEIVSLLLAVEGSFDNQVLLEE